MRKNYPLENVTTTDFYFPYPVRYPNQVTVEVAPGGVVPTSEYKIIGYGATATGVTIRYPGAPVGEDKDLIISRQTEPERVSQFEDDVGATASALNAEFDNVYHSLKDFAGAFGTLADIYDINKIEENPGHVAVSDGTNMVLRQPGDIDFGEFTALIGDPQDYDLLQVLSGNIINRAPGLDDTRVPLNQDMHGAGYARQVDSVSDLQSGSFPASLKRLWLAGYYGVGTAGGGPLYRDDEDTTTDDNGGTVFVDSDGVRWKRQFSGAVNVKWFGAKGDGVTDDTDAIQKTINTSDIIDFGDEDNIYLVSRTTTSGATWLGDFKYGLHINSSNKTLQGDGAKIARYDSIVDDEDAYYPLLIGKTSDVVGDQIENITIKGLHFEGDDECPFNAENVSGFNNNRFLILITNAKNINILENKFTKIDQSSIYVYGPCHNVTAYTKVYNLNIKNNQFYGEPHSTWNRARIFNIHLRGNDFTSIEGNYFEWTDVAVSTAESYQFLDQKEDDTWTHTDHDGVDLLRGGRNLNIVNNISYNNSHRSIYVGHMNMVITGNNFYAEGNNICNNAPRLYGTGYTATGNNIVGGGLVIAALTSQSVISGNTITVLENPESSTYIGVNFDTQNLYDVQDARQSHEFATNKSIVFSDNVIEMPEDYTKTYNAGIRMVTASNNEELDYEIELITIKNNTIKNAEFGIYVINRLYKKYVIEGNSFLGCDFTEAEFAVDTAMNSKAALVTRGKNFLIDITFNNNYVYGFKYVFASDDDDGTDYRNPRQINNNYFKYIRDGFIGPDMSWTSTHIFVANRGEYVLDYTLPTAHIQNNISDGVGNNPEGVWEVHNNRSRYRLNPSTIVFPLSADFQSSSNASLNDIDNARNTTGKFTGKPVWNTDEEKYVFATGTDAGDEWVFADGTTANTPT